MPRPAVIALGAVPAAAAALIAAYMLLLPAAPFSAAGPSDQLQLDYAVHQMQVIGAGPSERAVPSASRMLSVGPGTAASYSEISGGSEAPAVQFEITAQQRARLAAFFKETGFMALPPLDIAAAPNATSYEAYALRAELNGAVQRISWPEEAAAAGPVPPIVAAAGAELDKILGAAAG